jgi:hypothetical protein
MEVADSYKYVVLEQKKFFRTGRGSKQFFYVGKTMLSAKIILFFTQTPEPEL